jgi:hypothetical protein
MLCYTGNQGGTEILTKEQNSVCKQYKKNIQ